MKPTPILKQDKKESKNNAVPSLPLILINNNFNFFSDLATFSHLSRTNHAANNLGLISRSECMHAKELLRYLMDAKPKEAEALLKNLHQSRPTISLGLVKTSGKEKNGRISAGISPLEFGAAVSGDIASVNLLLSYVSHEDKKQALAQLKMVRDQGTEHGKYLENYSSLIDAYYKYLTNIYTMSCEEQDAWWTCEIGTKQKNLSLYGLRKLFGIERDLRLTGSGDLFLVETVLYERSNYVALYRGHEFDDTTPLATAFGRDLNADFEKMLEINKKSVTSLDKIIENLEKELDPKCMSS
jgi:hypothetical protein